MSATRPRPNWERLGTELRRLRRTAGKSQEDIARAIGASQPTVERIELGGRMRGAPPSWQKVLDWARACEVAGPDLATLRALTDAALDERAPFRDWPGDLASGQEDIAADEAVTATLRNFNPWGVPGLLQTADYARAFFARVAHRRPGDAGAAVQARLRRQRILLDGWRHLEFLVTETGLRWPLLGPDGMREQLEHIVSVTALPAVTVSVIPAGARPHGIPQIGFVLYENRSEGEAPFAAVEELHAENQVIAPEHLAVYRQEYALLRRDALQGDAAVAFVREMARSLPP